MRISLLWGYYVVIVQNSEFCDGENTDQHLEPSQPASFGGLDAVYRAVKEKGKNNITRKQVRDWLSQEDVYTLHNSSTVTVGIIHVTIRTDRKDLNMAYSP